MGAPQDPEPGVMHVPVREGFPAISVRYARNVRQLSIDYGERALPPLEYDYSAPTYLAHRAERGREFVGRFAGIRQGLDFEYHGCYTAERQLLQDVLINDVVGAGTQKKAPWVIFTAGAMGSGKGYVMDWLCSQGHFPLPDVVAVDPDRFRCEFPEWKGYLQKDPAVAGRMTHRESGYLVEIAQEAAMELSKTVWIDGSLQDGVWYSQVFERLRKVWPHYRIAIFHVITPWETVVARAASRARKTGRVVPEVDLRRSFEQVPESVERLAPLADFTVHVNNGEVPRLVRGPGTAALGDWREIRERFVVLPVLLKGSTKAKCFVEGLIGAHPVFVFSKSYCSYCRRVKRVLAEELGDGAGPQSVELDTMTLALDESGEPLCAEGDVGVAVQLELLKMTGQRLVPQVFIAGRHVGGCAEVLELQQRGALQPLLSVASGKLPCKH